MKSIKIPIEIVEQISKLNDNDYAVFIHRLKQAKELMTISRSVKILQTYMELVIDGRNDIITCISDEDGDEYDGETEDKPEHDYSDDYEEVENNTVNLSLAKKQGLNQQKVARIRELHIKRDQIESKMTTPELAIELFSEWTENEYELQELWGFDKNPLFHRSWYLPFCECPMMDNNERIPYGMIVNQSCPIHGIKCM